MATQTTHFELTKAELSDVMKDTALAFSDNFDVIDTELYRAIAGVTESVEASAAAATSAHTAGSYFWMLNVLHRATAAIAVGDAIVTSGESANATPVTIAGELQNVAGLLVFDDTPTQDSGNPVKSGGIYTALQGKLDTTLKGAANGVASLDSAGKVPSNQLPSYIDNVVEGYYYNGAFYEDQAHTQLITGESGKIYVDLETEQTYRWSGSIYVKISSTLELGETSDTAYRGDRGKTAYNHSQLTTGNPHSVTKSDVGLGNVNNTSDAEKPVSTAQQTALDAKANDSDVKAGTEAKKAYHLGFYIGPDGGLCQSDDEWS